MSFVLDIQYDDQRVRRRMKRFEKGLNDLRKPLLKSKDLVLKETDKQWGTKGSNLGTPWPKRLGKYPWPILQKTGRMRRGFSWSPYNPKDKVTIQNKVPYFKYHQSSAKRKTNLARRPMLHLNEKLKTDILQIFRDYIKTIK